MTGLASRGQLRMSFLRTALVIVPFILLLGVASGWVSGSSAENPWYDGLRKPDFTPPGAAFGIAWTILYILMGVAVTMIVYAKGARGRGTAITLFIAQFAVNLTWSPVFFATHAIGTALWIAVTMLLLATATTTAFFRIRPLAGWLMVPYVAWLCFAVLLNYQIDRLNPDAETLVPGASSTEMKL